MKIATIAMLVLAMATMAVAGEPVKVNVSAPALGRADPLLYERPPYAIKAKPKSSTPANGVEIKKLKVKIEELKTQLLWVGPTQVASPAPSTSPAPAPSESKDPRLVDHIFRKADWGHDGTYFWIRKDLVARLSSSSTTPEFLCDSGGMNQPGHQCEGKTCQPVKAEGLVHHRMTSDGDYWVVRCPKGSGKMRCNVFVGGRYIPDHNEREWPGVEDHPNDSGAWFVIE